MCFAWFASKELLLKARQNSRGRRNNRYGKKFQWQDKPFAPIENFRAKKNFLLKQKTLVVRENYCHRKKIKNNSKTQK